MTRILSARLLVAAYLLAGIFSFAGCSGKDEQNAAQHEKLWSGGQIRQALYTLQPWLERLETEKINGPEVAKWNAYVNLSDQLYAGYYESSGTFIDFFGANEEFKPPLRGQSSGYYRVLKNMSKFYMSADHALYISEKGESTELDRLASALSPLLMSLYDELVRFNNYLVNDKYLADGGLEGNRLQSRIKQNISLAVPMLKAFRAGMQAREDELWKWEAPLFRKAGLKQRPVIQDFVYAARQLNSYVLLHGVRPHEIGQLDLDVYRRLYSKLEQKYDTWHALRTDEEALAELKINKYFLIDSADKAKNHAKQVIEHYPNNRKAAWDAYRDFNYWFMILVECQSDVSNYTRQLEIHRPRSHVYPVP